MRKRNLKTRIAESVVKVAKESASRTVGKSIPLGMHEVNVPSELKEFKMKHAEDR